ncbi:sigma-70 family RNA polymerase sigma factor [Leptospira wolffii]|uniref:RNA polymerase sigma factor n=1 Tax=Leptospira wolffii TaxID=409998 RepID=UPI0010832D1E|nr:sigma-70 family RNA polymerase sigma factor [Leptospira wolffii]TGK55939.1 sigma-70 family RNA polymerase sigma factor [Leptospira wolffii]TGK71985.1 sigma-70 family RNA polymerase sigma factor [Leptospira wolffii]TGK78639.1 sigma-70 family RNA polymerase sigma factor [Leptospira wolffii]TGL27562.1 sigma-70 family RNA polymerase sigma factor [Leptospira wolffii]
MEDQDSLKHLFQSEFSKMVAVIAKLFGLQHLEIAEDIVSETFLQAAETWGQKGIPENPTAWLYVVAKRKTLHYFKRNKIFSRKIAPELVSEREQKEELPDLDFSKKNIKDSQLQMLFAVCNPLIASEAQIGLALRILCGFGIEEISEAFLTNKETINKRLFRAKEKLRSENIRMELPEEEEIDKRLDNVLHIVYLLFTEGYYSKTQDKILRQELCFEAVRLGVSLTEYERTNLPKTNALLALMCFHASRFPARQTEGESFILYENQNEELWDRELIDQGKRFLELSASGTEISSYHIEARIAFWHCQKEDSPEKWEEILDLYDRLLVLNYSPSVALNRVFALYKLEGWELALPEAEKLKLESNHFYFLLLGELYTHSDKERARENFLKAHSLAKTNTEKKGIEERIRTLV